MTSTDDNFETGTTGEAGFGGDLFGDPLAFLVSRRCREFAAHVNRDSGPLLPKALEEKEASVRGELEGMPAKVLQSLFKAEKENWLHEMRSQSGIIEESLDFMHPMYSADLAKWGAEASWTYR